MLQPLHHRSSAPLASSKRCPPKSNIGTQMSYFSNDESDEGRHEHVHNHSAWKGSDRLAAGLATVPLTSPLALLRRLVGSGSTTEDAEAEY
eukprot:4165582-Prymnesium_polylepis.1